MPQVKKIVMISSTARDLPQHRKEVMDACLRQGMFPLMMEHLPANDDEAIAASLKMVDEADIYIGVFAHRYGYTPTGHDISVTEMEYNRAVERKIPRCIFVIDENHTLADFTINDIDTGENAAKLARFKQRVKPENIFSSFKSPADLRAHAIHSLSLLRVPDLTAFHYVSDIPAPPEAFIAHPYTLLQTHRLVGRQAELNLLTDWVAKPEADVFKARILNVVAIGGMGKSALTWKWFNEIAPQEMKTMAGRMWWSFYESDATFENFVTRALAYTTRRPLAEVEQIPTLDREAQLLSALDREPFLIALDGLERMLIAYARMDAAHLADGDSDRQTANFVANAAGLPASAAQTFTGERGLRKAADPRAGAFLRKLTAVRASRILVSTRLYPADLQSVTGDPLNDCFALFLPGIAEDDALELWRAFGATGARDQLLPVFRSVDNHPLLIQSLAGEVARFRRAPGDFDAWRRAHPDFNPFRDIPLVQVKSHVLEYALSGLANRVREALHVIAAFRMPASYDTLTALLIGEAKPCASERELDAVLAELEDRGLVGWDKRANRYDLHPIVRGVVWDSVKEDKRQDVYAALQRHFTAFPERLVNNPEDLTPAIELFHVLVKQELFQQALSLYQQRLFGPLQFKFSLTNKQIEFLKMLFTDGIQSEPKLLTKPFAPHALRYLAESYHRGGQPKLAIHFYSQCFNYEEAWVKTRLKFDPTAPTGDNFLSHLQMLSDAYQLTGALYEACLAAYQTLSISRVRSDDWHEAIILSRIGLNYAIRGNEAESEKALYRSLEMFSAMPSPPREGGVHFLIAQLNVWSGNPSNALTAANRAWKFAYVRNFERDFIRTSRVQGAAALKLGDRGMAEERLFHALTRARQVNYVEEELPALIALAELRRREGKPGEARELLDDVWDGAERGPYPLFHADALNVLAQIERDAENRDAAVAAATHAYSIAWCDGPPYAYHWGLEVARKHLRELGAPEPEMPPFDPSKHEPMPGVEIDPEDKFHIGAQASRSPEE
jgi:tetratricopeptide (TPR) repeat protein